MTAPTSLTPEAVASATADLAGDSASFSRRYAGESARRQPAHTVFRHGGEAGTLALRPPLTSPMRRDVETDSSLSFTLAGHDRVLRRGPLIEERGRPARRAYSTGASAATAPTRERFL